MVRGRVGIVVRRSYSDRRGGARHRPISLYPAPWVFNKEAYPPLEAYLPLEAWTDSSALAAVWIASAAAAVRVFAAVAASVAGAAARVAAFSRHQPSVDPGPDVPAPASAGVSVVLGPAAWITSPALAGISGPASSSPSWEKPGVLSGAGLWDEPRHWADLDAAPTYSPWAELRDDSREAYRVPRPVWQPRLRVR